MKDRRVSWVLLAYRLPREPSTPRIALWRRLRRLGAGQVADGVAVLPLDARTREQMEWLADEVAAAGGEASVWAAELTSVREERELAARMASVIATEYDAVIAEATAAREHGAGRQRRTVARLRRELRRIRARDFFPPAERELAAQALRELEVGTEERVG